MNTPTRQAPHICVQVRRKISPSCWPLTRSRMATIAHDARIAEPPTNGLKSNTALIVAPWERDDAAPTTQWTQITPGSADHGPVQATTTATRTAIGIHA